MSFAGKEISLYDSTVWVSLAFILSIKRGNWEEQMRPQWGLLNWTHFKGGSQNCQGFDFLIPEEKLIHLAAWSTGSRNETPLAWPLVSIIMGGICIYIVNAQTFFTSWSMKSPFRWRKKYNSAFLGDVAVPSKASVAQRSVETQYSDFNINQSLGSCSFSSENYTIFLKEIYYYFILF